MKRQIYFALLIYSYAMHLRKGSYRSLPLSRSSYAASNVAAHSVYDPLADEEDEEIEDFYRVPLRTSSGHRRGNSTNNNASSITSFADFVSAPGRIPRKKGFGSVSLPKGGIEEEDILFDEDETYAASSSSRGHSKLGTDSSTTAASDEERVAGGYGSDIGKGKVGRHA
jgi:hypothetical protein